MNVSKNRSELFWWCALLGYVFFLYIVYTLPLAEIPVSVTRANDKVLHSLSFLLLSLVGFQTFSGSTWDAFRTRSGVKSAAFSIFYGAFLEWAQRTVPGRDMSFWDFLADSLGTLTAVAIFCLPDFFQKNSRVLKPQVNSSRFFFG